MTAADDIINQLPIQDLANRLGVPPETAEQAVRQTVPALIGGMQANASDPAGEASLASAVQQQDTQLIDGGVDLSQVDTTDGNKIVDNVFGDQRDAVINKLGAVDQQAGGGAGLIGKLLPMLAPVVMAYLAQRFLGTSSQSGAQAPTGTTDGSTPTLNPAQNPGAGGTPEGALNDLLGGLLGGGQGGSQGGALNDVLGGLLGGGRR